MTAALRVGLVGCGRVAERGWARALGRSPVFHLVAVADLDPARCAAVAPGVLAFGSAEALVAAARPDALLVTTPPADHLESARVAAAAGIPCLVEKPPAADVAEARALAALEPAPWIGFNRRFEPRLEALRSRLPRAGELAVALEFAYRRSAWGALDEHVDALLDVGVHLVDLARYLTRSDIVAVRTARVEALDAELELELGRGAAHVACSLDRPYRERVEVLDGAGRRLGRYDTGRRARALAARLWRGGAHPLVPTLARELDAFAAAARGEAAPLLATAGDGLAAMEAIEEARTAARAE